MKIQKSAYAMATRDGNEAEIILYGDIYETQPVDFWTGEPIEGHYILLDEFLEDLDKIADAKEITVRINSYGGDAGVSNTIHNRLRELSRNGAHLTGIVDGVAMSGGSHIMCACDTVKANPSSLIMIHKCLGFAFGYYNADELSKQSEVLDAWDRMQVEVYQRKTGLSNTVLMHMMSDTTFMTGREAQEKGFVDELLEDAEPIGIAASANRQALFAMGRQIHLGHGMTAPDSIPTVTPEVAASSDMTDKSPDNTGSEGGRPMTLDELREQHPELVAEIEAAARASSDQGAIAAAVQAEQQRIQEIDAIAVLYSDEMVQAAKYGDTACSAQELAFRAAKAAAKQGKSFLEQLQADATSSGTKNVGATPDPEDEGTAAPLTDAEKQAAGEAMAKKLNSKEA